MDAREDLHQFFEMVLRRLFSGEKLLEEQLGKLSERTTSRELSDVLKEHQEETASQVRRLNQIFSRLDMEHIRMHNLGNQVMESMVDELNYMVAHFAPSPIVDYVIALRCQCVEEVEIMEYNLAIQLAEEFKYKEVVQLLKQTLAEEEKAFDTMSDLVDSYEHAFETVSV